MQAMEQMAGAAEKGSKAMKNAGMIQDPDKAGDGQPQQGVPA
jgi:hypothetical protein